jgi:hypothetical protein
MASVQVFHLHQKDPIGQWFSLYAASHRPDLDKRVAGWWITNYNSPQRIWRRFMV